jgi:hypothetical protein
VLSTPGKKLSILFRIVLAPFGLDVVMILLALAPAVAGAKHVKGQTHLVATVILEQALAGRNDDVLESSVAFESLIGLEGRILEFVVRWTDCLAEEAAAKPLGAAEGAGAGDDAGVPG